MNYKLIQDEDARNPREEFDHLGKIVHWHRRYEFGERIDNPGQWLRDLPEGSVCLPLCLLDHSGLHIWVGSGAHWSDPGGWDSGQVGFIYVTPEDIRKEYSCKRITARTREQVKKCLKAEVTEFDQYLTGDVYGYVIEDEDGRQIDSCWGFYGHKYAEECAKEALKYAEDHSLATANAI
jgi:hypothetical protein